MSLSTCLWLATALLGVSVAEVPSSLDVNPSLQDILSKAHQGPLYNYPTSLTQGIIPVRGHFSVEMKWG